MTEPEDFLDTSRTIDVPELGQKLGEDDDTHMIHARNQTTLVKNINQDYDFAFMVDEIYSNPSQPIKEYYEDEASERTPQRSWCPSCAKMRNLTVKYVAPEVSVWRRIFCNDCFKTQDYVALHCCVACNIVITKIKYVSKTSYL